MKSWLREVGVILLETKPPGSSKKDWKAVNCSTRKFCTSPGSAWFLLTQNDFTEGLKHQWSSTWQLDTIFFGMDYMVTFTINIPQMLIYHTWIPLFHKKFIQTPWCFREVGRTRCVSHLLALIVPRYTKVQDTSGQDMPFEHWRPAGMKYRFTNLSVVTVDGTMLGVPTQQCETMIDRKIHR
jgi:hypothetical protein